MTDTSVRSLLEFEVGRAVDQAVAKLSGRRYRLWGEVRSVSVGRSRVFVELLDGKRWDRALTVSLPAKTERLEVGQMVCVEGELEPSWDAFEGVYRPRFRARQIVETRRRSKREWERRALLRDRGRGYRDRLPCPRRVAVLASPESRGLADFRAAVRSGETKMRLWEFSVSWRDMKSVIAGLNQALEIGPSVIVLCRGGGGTTGLALFDEPALALRVSEVNARVPVILAVGHQEDRSLVGEMCSRQVATPSAGGGMLYRLAARREGRVAMVKLVAALVLATVGILYAAWSLGGG